MIELNNVLKKHDLRTHSYQKLGRAILINTNQGKFIVKEKTNQSSIFDYLHSRNFDYYPTMIDDEKYVITSYIEPIDIPNEQKMIDLIKLVSLLHSKTTHYKEIDMDDYKKTYEEISHDIDYLFGYYHDLMNVIESKVYMSPSEYLLARNISTILGSLNFSKAEIQSWYELVSNNRKRRYVVLHNNLELDHFIQNKGSYLISWDQSKIDIPIYDLYKLYKKHGIEYDFESLLYQYESNYPLLEEERKLFFVLISLPDKIEFIDSEYNMCKSISNLIDYLYKTESLLSPYYSKKAEK